jgi:hypothetical protein
VREHAEAEMWEKFRPLIEAGERDEEERREEREAHKAALKAAKEVEPEPPAPSLPGMPADPDSVLNPEYSETNQGAHLRDGWLWVVMEWIRVIRDTEMGPVANIEAASTPPPNAFALLVLSTYALSGIDKRRELITRALGFATKSHDTQPDGGPQEGREAEGGFLDTL